MLLLELLAEQMAVLAGGQCPALIRSSRVGTATPLRPEPPEPAGSVDAAGLYHPLARLARHVGDEVEVAVVVQQRQARLLGGGGDQEVGNLASPLTARGQDALDLAGATDVTCRGLPVMSCRDARRRSSACSA